MKKEPVSKSKVSNADLEKFFVSCNLDFEKELAKELQEFWPRLVDTAGKPNELPLVIIETIPGGVLVKAPLYLGLQINLFSKLANRVLLRLHEFTAKDFPKVFQKINALKKNPIVFDAAKLGFEFEVSCSGSRLNNETRVVEMLEQIFGRTKEPKQALYVRIHDDLCTVSLDTTGVNLYQRSNRVDQGEAPLRETLAAFCARKLIEGMKTEELNQHILVDPMAGSGTLLLEASQLPLPTARTDFAFMQWPQTPKLFKTPLFRKNYKGTLPIFKKLEASDLDKEMSQLCEKRLKQQSLPFSVATVDLFKTASLSDGKRIIISNPPYGERLKATFSPPELVAKIVSTYAPIRFGVILKDSQGNPLEPKDKNDPLKGYKLLSKSSFLNGGLRVSFHVFSRFG